MNIASTLKSLRKNNNYTQEQVAEYISKCADRPYSNKTVSNWESGTRTPNLEIFLLLCQLYKVADINGTFLDTDLDFQGTTKLNTLGKNRVEEYIAMLSENPLFAEIEIPDNSSDLRIIRLYDIPAAAGYGSALESDTYEEFEIDYTVPALADFALRVSGDSMMPRFVDGQIIFVQEQSTIEYGEIGVFALNGDSYIKKMGYGALISLNPKYAPIRIHEFDTIRVFGKVIG